MADRSSARVFGQIFELMATMPTEEIKKLAVLIAPLVKECDFTTDQMNCDESLMILGIGEEYQETYGSGEDEETYTYIRLKYDK